jgi:NAD(P)H dehydrogenase (quinone)
MTYLVIGAAGAQGGATARHMLRAGLAVRGMTSTPTGLSRLPEGVEPFVADLADAARMKTAFTGVTHASVLLPMSYNPVLVASYIRNVAEAALNAGVERLAFNTGNRLPGTPTGLPAFETRRAAALTLLTSGVPTVVLRPPIYLDNLLTPWVSDGLVREGVLRYPLPPDLPVAWLAHQDLAAATLAALTRPGLAGHTLDLGGGDTLTGPQLAGHLGTALDRPVRYEPLDVEVFRAGLTHVLGDAAAAGVASTYRWVAIATSGASLHAPGPTPTPSPTTGSLPTHSPATGSLPTPTPSPASATGSLSAPTPVSAASAPAAGSPSARTLASASAFDATRAPTPSFTTAFAAGLYLADQALLEETLGIRLTPVSTWINAQEWPSPPPA